MCFASRTVTNAWTSSISFCFSSSSKWTYHLASRVFPARFWIKMKRICKKEQKYHEWNLLHGTQWGQTLSTILKQPWFLRLFLIYDFYHKTWWYKMFLKFNFGLKYPMYPNFGPQWGSSVKQDQLTARFWFNYFVKFNQARITSRLDWNKETNQKPTILVRWICSRPRKHTFLTRVKSSRLIFWRTNRHNVRLINQRSYETFRGRNWQSTNDMWPTGETEKSALVSIKHTPISIGGEGGMTHKIVRWKSISDVNFHDFVPRNIRSTPSLPNHENKRSFKVQKNFENNIVTGKNPRNRRSFLARRKQATQGSEFLVWT